MLHVVTSMFLHIVRVQMVGESDVPWRVRSDKGHRTQASKDTKVSPQEKLLLSEPLVAHPLLHSNFCSSERLPLQPNLK